MLKGLYFRVRITPPSNLMAQKDKGLSRTDKNDVPHIGTWAVLSQDQLGSYDTLYRRHLLGNR